MKFFIPGVEDKQAAENTYGGIRKFVSQQTGSVLSDRRIFRLKHRHDGKAYTAEVGEWFGPVGEVVVAILAESSGRLYYVCTPNRAVFGGEPILVGGHDVDVATDFESA